jgi:hypothetical protein
LDMRLAQAPVASAVIGVELTRTRRHEIRKLSELRFCARLGELARSSLRASSVSEKALGKWAIWVQE